MFCKLLAAPAGDEATLVQIISSCFVLGPREVAASGLLLFTVFVPPAGAAAVALAKAVSFDKRRLHISTVAGLVRPVPQALNSVEALSLYVFTDM